MLVLSDLMDKDLSDLLETELKVKITNFSPDILTKGISVQNNDIEAFYAMGACVAPPVEALAQFNFLEIKTSKNRFEDELLTIFKKYKNTLSTFLICLFVLVGVYVYLQIQLKVVQKQYDQLSLQEGSFLNEDVATIQGEVQMNTDKLSQYKNVRTKSDIAFILFKLASHLPKGSSLNELTINYDQKDANDANVTIDMVGNVFKDDPGEEIKVVDQIFSDFKNDKKLASYYKTVTVSLNLEESQGRKVTGFKIHCS